MNNLNITLSIEEINELLNALGQQPYIKVHGLITKIQNQASGQLQEVKPEQSNGLPKKEGKATK